MPTVEIWLATTTRAANLGYRVLIVLPPRGLRRAARDLEPELPRGASFQPLASSLFVEMISAATGLVVGQVEAWSEVEGWLDAREEEARWQRAA